MDNIFAMGQLFGVFTDETIFPFRHTDCRRLVFKFWVRILPTNWAIIIYVITRVSIKYMELNQIRLTCSCVLFIRVCYIQMLTQTDTVILSSNMEVSHLLNWLKPLSSLSVNHIREKRFWQMLSKMGTKWSKRTKHLTTFWVKSYSGLSSWSSGQRVRLQLGWSVLKASKS